MKDNHFVPEEGNRGQGSSENDFTLEDVQFTIHSEFVLHGVVQSLEAGNRFSELVAQNVRLAQQGCVFPAILR